MNLRSNNMFIFLGNGQAFDSLEDAIYAAEQISEEKGLPVQFFWSDKKVTIEKIKVEKQ